MRTSSIALFAQYFFVATVNVIAFLYSFSILHGIFFKYKINAFREEFSSKGTLELLYTLLSRDDNNAGYLFYKVSEAGK
jgi:hypothetical protein